MIWPNRSSYNRRSELRLGAQTPGAHASCVQACASKLSFRASAKRSGRQQPCAPGNSLPASDECGFTLIETTIALLVMMIVMLGSASLFAFATFNNSNAADRAQTLAVAQETMETLRRLRFSTAGTDTELNRPTYTQTVCRGVPGAAGVCGQSGVAGRQYNVVINIADTTPTVKTITVNVTPITAGPAWANNASWATVTLTTQRAKSDQP